MTRDGGAHHGEGSGPGGVGPLDASGSGREKPDHTASGAGGGQPFPPELIRFAELFRAGRFWDSHEVLEDPWRAGRSPFYHGLILLASAWVHVRRENPHGIDAQLCKALDALEGLPDAYLGVDVAVLRQAAARARATVARLRHDPPERWSEAVPPPPLPLDPGRVRGDEPELESSRARGRPDPPRT